MSRRRALADLALTITVGVFWLALTVGAGLLAQAIR